MKNKKLIKQIADDIQKIVGQSKATFFVKKKNVKIPTDEALYELKAEISNAISFYFYKKLNSLE